MSLAAEKKDIRLNTDTGLLKLIAAATMLIDHIGAVLFPGAAWLRLIGRVSWPLFAYCFVLGFIYTRSLKRYALRLGVFALIAEPFYLWAFEPGYLRALSGALRGQVSPAYLWEGLELNIFFTLLLGLAVLYGLRERKYWLSGAALALSLLPCVNYGLMGVLLIAVLWLFIGERPAFFGLVLALFLSTYFLEPGWFRFFGLTVNIQGFCVLAVPLMCMGTHSGLRLPKYFYYVFYPAHLLALVVLKQYIF